MDNAWNPNKCWFMARVAFTKDLPGINDLLRLLSVYSMSPGLSSMLTWKRMKKIIWHLSFELTRVIENFLKVLV